MISNVAASTRKLLVGCRCVAMRGHVDAALVRLRQAAATMIDANKVLDGIAIAMLQAELLHLDGQDAEANAVFKGIIETWPKDAPTTLTFVAGNNRNDAACALFSPESAHDFYRLLDEQRLAGFELSNPIAVLSAEEAAADDKHHEALPGFWRELVRTYRQGCWRPFRRASQRMAKECLAIGLPHEAAYHAVIAQDDKLAKTVGERLLFRRDPQAIRQTVVKLLTNANLRRHFCTACEIIASIGDAIPDDQFDQLLQWLLQRSRISPQNNCEQATLVASWDALQALCHRLNAIQAKAVVESAVTHPCWNAQPVENCVIVERQHLLNAVNRCADAIGREELPALAKQVLPLATLRKQHADYSTVIELTYRLADRGGESLKSHIRDQLFPPNTPIDVRLAQAAPLFGKPFVNAEQLAQNAEIAAHNIRLQVQHLRPDQDEQMVNGSLMFLTHRTDSEKVIIHLTDMAELETMIAHRHFLPADSLRKLIATVLDLLKEQENFLANKASLIHAFRRLGDVLTDELARFILKTLRPLALGQITEPTLTMTEDETEHPLNPTRMRTGNRAEVRGMALYALARITKDKPSIFGRRLDPILESALSDQNPKVRSYSFIAAREMPKLSSACMMAVLLGTRDSDPNAAAAAFGVLATKKDVKLSRSQWVLLVYSLTLALHSPAVNVRREAAHAVTNVLPQTRNARLGSKLKEIRDDFAADICYSVREAAAFCSPQTPFTLC